MKQSERRRYLIGELLKENQRFRGIRIPSNTGEQKQLLRYLMNVRWVAPISPEFEQVQDEYLQVENAARGIVGIKELKEYQQEIYLWQGDITRLRVGTIVNAANSGMTGCYQPCHNCIDNAILM